MIMHQRNRLLFMFFDPCKDDISLAVCRIGQEYSYEKGLCGRVTQRQKRDGLSKRMKSTTFVPRDFTPTQGRKVFYAARTILFETGHNFRLLSGSVKNLVYKEQKHFPPVPDIYSTELQEFLRENLYPLYNYESDGLDDLANTWRLAVKPLRLSTYKKYQLKWDKYMFKYREEECYMWFFTRLRESAENFIQSRMQLQNLLYSPNVVTIHAGYSSFTDIASNTMLIPKPSIGKRTRYMEDTPLLHIGYYGTQKLEPEDAFRYGIWSPAFIEQGKFAENDWTPKFFKLEHEYDPRVFVSVKFSDATANAKSRGWVYVVDTANQKYEREVLNIIPPENILGCLDMGTGYFIKSRSFNKFIMSRTFNNNQGDEPSPNQCSLCVADQRRTECNWDPMVSGGDPTLGLFTGSLKSFSVSRMNIPFHQSSFIAAGW